MFVGEAVTEPRYRLLDCGEFPALVDDDANDPISGRAIVGEVFDVSPALLARLDAEEGVSEGLYERREIALAGTFRLDPIEAWFYRPSVRGLDDCGTSWKVYRAAQRESR